MTHKQLYLGTSDPTPTACERRAVPIGSAWCPALREPVAMWHCPKCDEFIQLYHRRVLRAFRPPPVTVPAEAIR